jgi:ribosomal protein S18 acetylase RimI-like enzyme
MTENLRIRALARGADDAAVFDLFNRTSDYVVLEDGHAPTPAKVDEYFTEVVPGGNLAQAVRLGAEQDGRLIGIADMGFGYPNATDAYIGLLMFDASARGQGLGRKMLTELTAIAQARGATRQLVAVLEANPRGLAFWQRQGFTLERVFEPQVSDPLQHRRFRMTRPIA